MNSASRLLKVLLSIFAVTVTSACLFGAGAITAAKRGWLQPHVQVMITNHSGQPIHSLRLRYTGAAQQGELEWRQPIPQGTTKTLRFDVAGEASYDIEVILANRTHLKGGAGYVESGYRTQETIMPQSITSKTDITGF